MPGFSARDDLILELTTNGKLDLWNFSKTAAQASLVGVWQTLWRGVGNPGAGADPAATPGNVHDSDQTSNVAGSIWFPDRSTDQRHGLSFGAVASATCTLMLYDRLAAVSGIALSATGNKVVTSGALTRYSGTAAGLNEAWLELTTATLTTAPIVNLSSYTSADGTAAQVGGSVTFPSTATPIGAMIPLPLAAGKTGVRSVETGVNVGTASANGIANLVILRPLVRIGLIANIWNEVSLLDDVMDLPRIFDNATLGLAVLHTAATTVTLQGKISCAYG